MGASIASQLEYVNIALLRYELPVVFGVGIIGNVVNMIIFSRRNLRINVCSVYFIFLSLAHLVLLIFSCLPRCIAATSGYDLSQYSLTFCKLRAYATDLSIVLARQFLCFISIDRWLITSPNLHFRHWSSYKTTYRLIAGSCLFWSLFNLHAPINYVISHFSCSPPLGTAYEFFYSIYNIITSILPMLIMAIFSVLAVKNIRSRVTARVYPIVNSNPQSNRPALPQQSPVTGVQILRGFRRETQLIRLSILQVCVFLVMNTLRAIFPLYSFILNSRGPLSTTDRSLARFLSGFGATLVFTYTAVSATLYFFGVKYLSITNRLFFLDNLCLIYTSLDDFSR